MPPRPKRALRFTHLRLGNWCNFPGAEVNLSRRVFLVGPNASGKSNLLDALRFLHDIASVGGGLQEAVRRRGGLLSIRSLAARRTAPVFLGIRIGNDADPASWEYELALEERGPARTPSVARERVRRNGKTVLERPTPLDRKDPERLTQTHVEQVHVNRAFREVAEFLVSVRYLHIVPQLVREPDRSTGRKNDPFGGDFLEQVAREEPKTRESRLRHIRAALRVAVPQLLELRLERDRRGTPHLHARCEHWKRRGAWQTEERFSDGTLRLMGLLWALLDGRGPLLLEEPELSLHPEVVRFIPPMFARVQARAGRQVLVSTHSPDLLHDTGIGLDEVLMLIPQGQGTRVVPAATFLEIPQLLEGGLSLAEAVLPRTSPSRASRLTLFGR